MTLMRSLLWRAARRIAADPRVRAEAKAVYRREVEPRVKTAWAETRPKIDRARSELAEAAREADPRQDPRAFLRSVKDRFRRRDG